MKGKRGFIRAYPGLALVAVVLVLAAMIFGPGIADDHDTTTWQVVTDSAQLAEAAQVVEAPVADPAEALKRKVMAGGLRNSGWSICQVDIDPHHQYPLDKSDYHRYVVAHNHPDPLAGHPMRFRADIEGGHARFMTDGDMLSVSIAAEEGPYNCKMIEVLEEDGTITRLTDRWKIELKAYAAP